MQTDWTGATKVLFSGILSDGFRNLPAVCIWIQCFFLKNSFILRNLLVSFSKYLPSLAVQFSHLCETCGCYAKRHFLCLLWSRHPCISSHFWKTSSVALYVHAQKKWVCRDQIVTGFVRKLAVWAMPYQKVQTIRKQPRPVYLGIFIREISLRFFAGILCIFDARHC